jgi:hypothetical protein
MLSKDLVVETNYDWTGVSWSYFYDLTCVIMFFRRIDRRKNDKTHLYWSVVENKRLDGGRVVQRHVLYLGEINSSQAETSRKAVEVFDAEAGGSQTLALFPEDHCEAVADVSSVVRLRLSDLRLHRPRQWGACWLARQLWRDLQLDRFWAERLSASRKRTRWDRRRFRGAALRSDELVFRGQRLGFARGRQTSPRLTAATSGRTARNW